MQPMDYLGAATIPLPLAFQQGLGAAQGRQSVAQDMALAQSQEERAQVQFGQQNTLFDQGQQDRAAMMQAQAAEQAAMAQRQSAVQADLAGLADKISTGAYTFADFAQIITRTPELAEEVKGIFDGLTVERRSADTAFAAKALSALKTGNPEIAARMLDERAIAAENSNDRQEADLARAAAALARSNPEAAIVQLGIVLAASDPDAAKAVLGDSSNSGDRFKVVGNQLVDLEAEGGPQSVITAEGQTETIYGPDGKPILTRGPAVADMRLTETQGKATGFVYRMEESHKTLNELEKQGTSLWNRSADALPIVGNYMRSDDAQKFDQAKRDFINAILRQESGAVIGAEEFANADKQYFPQPGDSVAVIEQKRRNREVAIDGVRASAGKGGETSPRAAADGSDSPGPTGQAIEIPAEVQDDWSKYGGGSSP